MERPQLLLPFAEREYIDMARCCRILGCSWTVIQRLHEAGEIELIGYRKRGHKRIRYASVVEYCGRLREQFCIPDRRPTLSNPILRHRDEDLLPFPLRDTTDVASVQMCLGYSSANSVIYLIETGPFEAYRLLPLSPWRVSIPSFLAWLQRVMPQRYAQQSTELSVSAGA